MSTELTLATVVLGLFLAAVVVWLFARGRLEAARRAAAESQASLANATWPAAGFLVPQDVYDSAEGSADSILTALEATAAPVAVEYFPVGHTEITKYRTVPVNATVQKSLVEIVKRVNPKGATLFRVVLPQGEKLVKAVGAPGWYRGWAHNGANISSQALLKPVAAGGALAAGWPIFAVAGTVMVVDMIAQREQRAFQQKVETLLARHEIREYDKRIAAQQTADNQLTRAISMMLDGKTPDLDAAVARTDEEFNLARQFLLRNRNVIERLVGDDGKADYRRLEEGLGGRTKDVDYFLSQLYLARAANALRRKALIADAASHALADPANPYAALRKHFELTAEQLVEAEAIEASMTDRLREIELKGRWRDRVKDRLFKSDKSVEARQARLRSKVLPAAPGVDPATDDAELRYVATVSGEILQVLPPQEDLETDAAREHAQ